MSVKRRGKLPLVPFSYRGKRLSRNTIQLTHPAVKKENNDNENGRGQKQKMEEAESRKRNNSRNITS
jgi:hypothetical protein